MEMDLTRELDLAQLAADIQHAAALEFLVRKGLPVGDRTLLRSAARRLDGRRPARAPRVVQAQPGDAAAARTRPAPGPAAVPGDRRGAGCDQRGTPVVDWVGGVPVPADIW